MTLTKEVINNSVLIQATVAKVWKILTEPELMKQWMAEPGMELDIVTTWQPGTSIIISGFHHIKFQNKGIVLRFEPDHILQYNYLSSLSRLPDKPENYSDLEFCLTPVGNQTELNLCICNFPTETIFKHIDFYWRSTLVIIKEFAESK